MPDLNLTIDKVFDKTLQDLVESNTDTKTKADVVQRAVAAYKYFRTLQPGQKIQIVDGDDNVVESDLKVP